VAVNGATGEEEQLRPRGPDRHGAAAGGGTTKAERLDPAESNSDAGAYPTTAGSYRHDECRPIALGTTLDLNVRNDGGRRHGGYGPCVSA
jgi:hypothetical protein